jgi:tetratricopeptide (TPR) repeat protein
MKDLDKKQINSLSNAILSEDSSPKVKKLLLAIGCFVLLVLGGFSYYELYHLPEEEKLNERIWVSILDLKNQNYQDAFSGTDDYYGFDALANTYTFAASSNIARYGAGISALHLKKYDEAIQYLSNVYFKDELLQTLTKMALGDTQVEKNDLKAAISAYKSAWKTSAQTNLFPIVGQKLGLIYELEGQNQEAIKIYQELIQKMDAAPSNSPASTDIMKNIQKLLAKLSA